MGSACAIAQGPTGPTCVQSWAPERWLQVGAGMGKGSYSIQRRGDTVLQMETGRAGSPEPGQNTSESSSENIPESEWQEWEKAVSLDDSPSTGTKQCQ